MSPVSQLEGSILGRLFENDFGEMDPGNEAVKGKCVRFICKGESGHHRGPPPLADKCPE